MITEETESNFKDMLELIHSSCSNTTSNQALSIDELLSSSIECYLQQMTSDQRREMSVNIVKKFKENKLNSNHSKIIKLVVLYSKMQIIPLYRALIKWKSTNKIEMQMLYQLSTHNQEEVSKDFQKPPHRHPPIYGSLIRNKNGLSRSMMNFIERQEKFKKTQSQSIARVISNNEMEYTMLCTFNPQINHQSTPCLNNYTNKVNQKDPCLRLYEESKLRLTKKEQFEKERNVIGLRKRKNSTTTPNKNMENQYVKQYEDYKKQKENKKRLKERLDNESDCTFMPKSYHNRNYCYNVSIRQTSRPSSNYSRNASHSLIDSIISKAKNCEVTVQNQDNLPQNQ